MLHIYVCLSSTFISIKILSDKIFLKKIFKLNEIILKSLGYALYLLLGYIYISMYLLIYFYHMYNHISYFYDNSNI